MKQIVKKMVDIEGYPGYLLYFDDETCQPKIKSLRRNRPRWLNPQTNSNGYVRVHLSRDDNPKARGINIHRIVAECCIPNPEKLPTVDHINGNKLDNRIENLRWASHSTQGLNRLSIKGCCYTPRGKWFARIMIRGKRVHLGYFESEAEAKGAYELARAPFI